MNGFWAAGPTVTVLLDWTPNVVLTVFLERKSGITGVPFGRTDLSIGGIGTTVHALLHRHGPVGPSFQGMPEKSLFHVFLNSVLDVF